ncbi:glycoside hydrolase family 105 protein [Trichoderma novae-zelandiae]
MPLTAHGFDSRAIHSEIQLLIDGLVNIKDETGEFLMTLADGRVIDTKGWNDWEWTHGVGLYGIWHYYQTTGDAKYLQIIEDWFQDRFAAGGTTKNINTMAAMLTLAYVYDETKNPTYFLWLDSWAEWAYHDLERTKYGGMQHITYLEDNDQQLWDDTLMMTVLPLAKIGLVLDRPHYVKEAKYQFLLHIQYLFDSKTGLFFHGWCFNDGGHNFASARWARGNSWLTIVIPEMLELLELASDDPATAGFAFGLLKGQRKHYLEKGYQDIAFKAIQGVLNDIDSTGQLLTTSFGTGMGSDLEFYKKIPVTPMPYGQAMAILALVELLKIFI